MRRGDDTEREESIDPLSEIEYRTMRRTFYGQMFLGVLAFHVIVSWLVGLTIELMQGMYETRAISESIAASLPWLAFGIVVGLVWAFVATDFIDNIAEMVRGVGKRGGGV